MADSRRRSGSRVNDRTQRAQAAPVSVNRRPVVRIIAALAIFAMLAGLIAAVIATAASSGGDDPEVTEPEQPPAAELTPPPPGESLTGPTPCPPLDGTAARTTRFEEPTSDCLDPEADYLASIVTQRGTIEVTLDMGGETAAVNEFVSLAAYHYWDSSPFEVVLDRGLIASWRFRDETTIGPGYDLMLEPPTDPSYGRGDVVMFVTEETATAQFSIVTTDEVGAFLGPGDVVIGTVTSGLDVADNIVAFAGSELGLPIAEVIVDAVVITESL